jgi:hypothetical protein
MKRPEMTTATFWAGTVERAVKTMAQVAAALIGTGAVGITELDWAQIGSVAATAAVVSVLTSLASDRIGPAPGPSLTGEAVTVPEVTLPPRTLQESAESPVKLAEPEPLPTSTPAVYPLRGVDLPVGIAPDVAATQPAPAAGPAELAARSAGVPA